MGILLTGVEASAKQLFSQGFTPSEVSLQIGNAGIVNDLAARIRRSGGFIAGPGPLATSTVPGGIIMPGLVGEITQRLLDKFLPRGGGVPAPLGMTQLQGGEPVRDLPMIPDFIDTMLSGTLPRGAVRPITGPNGLPDCPRGFHFHKGGRPWCVRNRRMNALNPRALSRASRRVGGFARAVKRARTLKKVVRNL